MSDSVRPQRRQPTRLPHPWDSPGKNTGVGCHFLLQCMKVKSKRQAAQSCPTLSDPMDCSAQAQFSPNLVLVLFSTMFLYITLCLHIHSKYATFSCVFFNFTFIILYQIIFPLNITYLKFLYEDRFISSSFHLTVPLIYFSILKNRCLLFSPICFKLKLTTKLLSLMHIFKSYSESLVLKV